MPPSASISAKNFDPRVDEKIARAQPFAQPILAHLRELVHKAVPEITEDIKWSKPMFLLDGNIFCMMDGFKAHCAFGFWKSAVSGEIERGFDRGSDGLGDFGRITSLKELPSDKEMIAIIKRGAALARAPQVEAPKKKAPKPELPVPPALEAALKQNKAAAKNFTAMSPSCRREYSEWIGEAKRDETRDKRLTQAMEWIAEGKSRHWKYQDC